MFPQPDINTPNLAMICPIKPGQKISTFNFINFGKLPVYQNFLWEKDGQSFLRGSSQHKHYYH